MTTYKQWREKIENSLECLRAFKTDNIAMRFTLRELIELKLIIETCEILARRGEVDNDETTS